jgi:hypothetical protein
MLFIVQVLLKKQNKPFKAGHHRSQHEIKRSTDGFLIELSSFNKRIDSFFKDH